MFVMIVKDRTGYNNETIKYKKFEDIAAHAQQVIARQIGEEISSTLAQDNPLDWKEQLDAMAEILQDLYSMDEKRIVSAIEAWEDLAESDNVGDIWIEYLG